MSLSECTTIDHVATALEEEIIPTFEAIIDRCASQLKRRYSEALRNILEDIEQLRYELSSDNE